MKSKKSGGRMSQSQSHYQERSGIFGTSGKLASIEGRTGLRIKQERRITNSCTIEGEHRHGVYLFDSGRRDLDRCNGAPWPTSASRKADARAAEESA
jgi:hypothetical protein